MIFGSFSFQKPCTVSIVPYTLWKSEICLSRKLASHPQENVDAKQLMWRVIARKLKKRSNLKEKKRDGKGQTYFIDIERVSKQSVLAVLKHSKLSSGST